MKLTPALLAGKTYTETVRLEDGDNVYEIEIRSLTHLEKSEVEAIEQASVNVQTKNTGKSGRLASQALEVNAGQLVKDQAKAKLKMIALGTTDTEWTEQTVDQFWRSEWINQVAEQIAKISGIERQQAEQQDSFRAK